LILEINFPHSLFSPCREYIDTAVRHVLMRQGVLGVKVVIMLPHDPKGIVGPKTLLDDVITILEPKDGRGY
jgi:small subunit ribosomal protein S3e